MEIRPPHGRSRTPERSLRCPAMASTSPVRTAMSAIPARFPAQAGSLLSDDGSVTNTAKGTITATGKMPSPLATISGIYVTGPSSAGIAAISVTNAGVVTAADGYGIGLGRERERQQLRQGDRRRRRSRGFRPASAIFRIRAASSRRWTTASASSRGGTVTNAAGASISGVVGVDAAGIFVIGGFATITNSGQITGLHYGILVAAGGTVTNNSTGTITGQDCRRRPEPRRDALQLRLDFRDRGPASAGGRSRTRRQCQQLCRRVDFRRRVRRVHNRRAGHGRECGDDYRRHPLWHCP